MTRMLQLALAVYLPHLAEEHFTQMYDDPIIVFAYSRLATLPPRAASYLIFQLMLMVALSATLLFSLGGRWQRAVMVALAVALLAESHHLLRFAVNHQYNSGLLTAGPMPLLGLFILHNVRLETRSTPCFTP